MNARLLMLRGSGLSKRAAKRAIHHHPSRNRPCPAPIGMYRRLSAAKRRRRLAGVSTERSPR